MSLTLLQQVQDALTATHRVDGEMRHGGMSRLFSAMELETGRKVVVKVLPPELAAEVSLARFRREIRVAQSLNHPAIVPVLSVGQAGSITFYTMPLIEGESLRGLLDRERQLSVEQALRIVHDVAEALDHANGHNIVHRDIKPDNILLDKSGRAVVTDFGIARAIQNSADLPSVTTTGLTIGTPSYMSPEQGTGDRFIDGRSDVYSLGCVLFEMLAGDPPFTGPTAQAIIARHIQEEPRSLRTVRPDVSMSLQHCVERALAKVPAARFASAKAFADALEHPLPSEPNPQPIQRRNRRLVLGGLIALATVAVAMRFVSGVTERPDTFDLRRIAVLDFEDQSPDHSLDYLTKGLTSSLVHELTAFGPLTVMSQNGLRTFRERSLPLDSMVSAFRLGTLVVGSVERSGERLRVRVQLLDARSNAPLESATFERTMGELFLLEDDLAHQVAILLRQRIGVELRVREMIVGTRSAKARELVYRADKLRDEAMRESANGDTTALSAAVRQLERADSLLDAAERADGRWIVPTIDRGWVALDIANRQSGELRVTAFERADAHAARALARDSTSAQALELRGTSLYGQAARLTLKDADFANRLLRAEYALSGALDIDSSLATARGTRALVRFTRGNVLVGARDARMALAMDTYLKDAPTILLALYGNDLMQGATRDAWQWCERGASEFPRDARFIECRLTLLAEDDSRKPDPALAWSLVKNANDLDPPSRARAAGRAWLPVYREMMAAHVCARAGQRDSALAVAQRARLAVSNDETLRTDLLYEEAYLQLVLGNHRKASALLDEYLKVRPSLRGLVTKHPRWKTLRRMSGAAGTLAPTADTSRR